MNTRKHHGNMFLFCNSTRQLHFSVGKAEMLRPFGVFTDPLKALYMFTREGKLVTRSHMGVSHVMKYTFNLDSQQTLNLTVLYIYQILSSCQMQHKREILLKCAYISVSEKRSTTYFTRYFSKFTVMTNESTIQIENVPQGNSVLVSSCMYQVTDRYIFKNMKGRRNRHGHIIWIPRYKLDLLPRLHLLTLQTTLLSFHCQVEKMYQISGVVHNIPISTYFVFDGLGTRSKQLASTSYKHQPNETMYKGSNFQLSFFLFCSMSVTRGEILTGINVRGHQRFSRTLHIQSEFKLLFPTTEICQF